MKRYAMMFIIYSLFINATAVNVNAHEEPEKGLLEDLPIEISADIAINSKYIWRGITLDDDPVMQQGIYATAYGFTATIWGSFDIDADDSRNSDEVDYVIDYTHEIKKFSLSLGHTYYEYPTSNTATREFYIGAGVDLPLSPALTWYHDYGEEDSGGGDGNYLVLDLSHSFDLGDSPVDLYFSGHVGYNNELFIKGDGGDVAIGAGLTVPLTKKISFSPNINYSIPLGDLADSHDGNEDDKLYGGFTLVFSF